MKTMRSVLTAVVLLNTGPIRASELDAAGLERRSLDFAASAGDVRLELVSARHGCVFEGSDGRRSRQVWLLTRDGTAGAVTPVVPFASYADEERLRPPPEPQMASRHGELPLADGPEALEGRLRSQAWASDATVSLRCDPPKRASRLSTTDALAMAPSQVLGLIAFSPVILFGVPVENASLTRAARDGPSLAGNLKPGEPVPGGLEAFARKHRDLVRVHRDPASDYAVLSIDLGGAPRYGIGAPRDVAFFGVRDGVIEWRGGRDMGIESALCANSKGAFGGRPGCTKTGYYNPDV